MEMDFIFASSCFLLESHAFQWRAAAWPSPSALPVPHWGLCAVTLRKPGLEGGVRARLGVGKEGKNSKLGDPPPPVDLGFFLHPPTVSTFVLSFFVPCFVFSRLFNHIADKAGPEDNWAQAQNWRVPVGLSETATEVT